MFVPSSPDIIDRAYNMDRGYQYIYIWILKAYKLYLHIYVLFCRDIMLRVHIDQRKYDID